MWWSYKPYVSAATRRANAAREIKKLEKSGQKAQPVAIEGRTIARTFWGKAWCDNLESYSDYDNRLPRGRTYVRNGSVCDLRIEPGRVTALVCGSELYKIAIKIKPLAPAPWNAIKRECAGQIGSLIELLQGKLSQSVMRIITRQNPDGGGGLFPKPAEIDLDCSCPDWADMCKHVAAAMYGVGARLDERPELLFVLRQVDHLELLTQAGNLDALTRGKPAENVIADDALSDVFGIDFEIGAEPKSEAPTPAPASAPARGKERGRSAEASRGTGGRAAERNRAAEGKRKKPDATAARDRKKSKAPRAKATRAKATRAKATSRRGSRATKSAPEA